MGEQQKNPSTLRAGASIGNYRVVRLLGKGGMATVFEAVNEHIGKRVAVKVLLPQYSQNEEIERRFLNEARAVNLVRHPGLIDIYEFGRTPDGCTCIVMEYLDGEPLQVYLHRAGRLPLPRTLGLLSQVASALAATHDKGIVHRDIKPGNIIIIKDPAVPFGERAKIVDFGIAKMTAALTGSEERTKTGILMGTPAYMAPEQCKDLGQATDRTDVYSLGIILYQALSGQLPFTGNPIPVMMKQIAEAPPSLHTLDATLPGEVVGLVHAMLAKESGDRPAMSRVETDLVRLSAMETDLLLPQPSRLDLPRPPARDLSPPTTLSSSIIVLEGKTGASQTRRRWPWLVLCVALLGTGATVLWLKQRDVTVTRPRPPPVTVTPPRPTEKKLEVKPEIKPEIKPPPVPQDKKVRRKPGPPRDISNDEVELLE